MQRQRRLQAGQQLGRAVGHHGSHRGVLLVELLDVAWNQGRQDTAFCRIVDSVFDGCRGCQ